MNTPLTAITTDLIELSTCSIEADLSAIPHIVENSVTADPAIISHVEDIIAVPKIA